MNEFSDLSLNDIKVNGTQLVEKKEEVKEETKEETKTETPAEEVKAETKEEVKTDAPAEVKTETKEEVKTETELPQNIKTETPEYKFKDDFIKGAVEYYEKTGDITPYLQAKTVDFTKLSDEEIMRRDLREQYSDISDKAFEALYKEQIVDKFKLDEEVHGADASSIGREFLKREAEAKRKKFLEWQSSFTAPERAEDKAEAEAQAEVERHLAEFRQNTISNAETKAIIESKKLALKVGDVEVSYEVADPNSLLDMTLDNQKFFNQFQNPDKSINYKQWYKVLAYSQNPEQFEKILFDNGKAQGREEIEKEIKNPSKPIGGDPQTEEQGDFTTGLLNAFAKRGVHK